MASGRALAVMRGGIDAGDALRDIAGEAGVPVRLERTVLYPYLAFTARCSVPTIGGRKALSFACLVDAINGNAATSDGFATDAMSSTGEMALHAVIDDDAARSTAQRAVSLKLGRQLKLIAPFGVHLEGHGTVYRRFFVVRIGDDRIMMDSVSGAMQPLQAGPA